jgi:hypothetical protein
MAHALTLVTYVILTGYLCFAALRRAIAQVPPARLYRQRGGYSCTHVRFRNGLVCRIDR